MQSIIAFIMAVISAIGLYPRTGYITEIADGKCVVEDSVGIEWEFETDADDWLVGDGIAMIVYDNETPDTIYDDVVVASRYSGFWR